MLRTHMKLPRAVSPQLIALVVALGVIGWSAFASIELPPETRVASFLEATARGDESAALSTWQLWPCCIERPALEARRTGLTKELADLGVGIKHRILFTEWWSSCCEPRIVDDPAHAGRARIFVSATDKSGREHELVFEVVAEKRISLSGPGHDLGPWVLREVHRRGERSAMGGAGSPLTEEAAIRSAQSLTGIGLVRDSRELAPGTTFAVKTSTVGELKRLLGDEDFVVPADPARRVWIVGATGPATRGGTVVAGSATVVLDIDQHTVLGVDFHEQTGLPSYFARLPER